MGFERERLGSWATLEVFPPSDLEKEGVGWPCRRAGPRGGGGVARSSEGSGVSQSRRP